MSGFGGGEDRPLDAANLRFLSPVRCDTTGEASACAELAVFDLLGDEFKGSPKSSPNGRAGYFAPENLPFLVTPLLEAHPRVYGRQFLLSAAVRLRHPLVQGA